MSAEQRHHHETLTHRFAERLRQIFSPVIRQFDATPAFEKYFSDIASGVDQTIAKKRMMNLLEANLRSFTQEGIGEPEINEYGFEITRARNIPELGDGSDRVVLRSLLYNDTQREQKTKLLGEENPLLRERYLAEFAAWEKVWNELLPSVEKLVGSEPTLVIQNIERLGFRKRIFDPTKESSDPHENKFSPNRLCDVTKGLSSLFPELEGKDTVEIYEHPTKYAFISPRFSLYHQGETSIARTVRLVYIPSIHTFAFLESGLFTAYTNQEISHFLTLDGRERPPDFDTPKELLRDVTVLLDQYTHLAPHAVFQLIIDKLGHFPEVPVGENVIREGKRSLQTQLEFLEKIFDFEQHLLEEYPHFSKTLSERLRLASEPILHSLLRNRELDAQAQAENYMEKFSDTKYAQNPRAVTKIFRAGVLSIHPDFGTRVVSLIDCGTGTIFGGITNTMKGMELNLSLPQMMDKIKAAEESDIQTWDELVKFCKPFGIPPEWFHRNTSGEQCVGHCKRTDRNWMGSCGMCPQCNARFNLEHGIVPNVQEKEVNQTDAKASPIDALFGGGIYAEGSLSVDKFLPFWLNTERFRVPQAA